MNGVVDGDSIKAEQVIETGVTVAAPIAVGAAIKPSAAPNTLESLGALPEIEANSVVTDIKRQGKIIETQGTFSEREATCGVSQK